MVNVSIFRLSIIPLLTCSCGWLRSRILSNKITSRMTSSLTTFTSKQIHIPGYPIVDILFEDKDMIIINKPSGMLSVPGNVESRPTPKKPRFEEWRTAIKASYDDAPENSDHKRILEEVNKRISIPRKRKLFSVFLEKNFQIKDEILKESIYNDIVIKDEELHTDALSDLPLDMVSATHLAENYCGHRLYQVHRLDMETSGILVQAKTDIACEALCKQFREREISKAYVAKVIGKVEDSLKTINIPIKPDYAKRPIQIVDFENGKPSETLVRVLGYDIKEDIDVSFVHLTPITGRTHQLRLHMDYVGHPILGDPLYGSLESKTLSKRLCLHAFYLKCKHPSTLEDIEFTLPYEGIFS